MKVESYTRTDPCAFDLFQKQNLMTSKTTFTISTIFGAIFVKAIAITKLTTKLSVVNDKRNDDDEKSNFEET